MQPLETEGKVFIEVTLRLWPPSHSICMYLYLICLYIHVWHGLSICHLVSLNCRIPSSLNTRRRGGNSYTGGTCTLKNSVLFLSVIIHLHISKFQASNDKKLEVIWREILAHFRQRVEGWSSKFHVGSSCLQRGSVVGDGMNNCEQLPSECQG